MKHPEIYDLLVKGLRPGAIAEKLQVSPETVYSTRSNYNLPTARKLREQAVERLFKLRKSDEQIGKELHIKPGTVKRIRQVLGLSRRVNYGEVLKDADWSKTHHEIALEYGVPYSSAMYWRTVYAKAD